MKKLLLVLILLAGAFFVGRNFDKIKKRFEKISFLKPNLLSIIAVAVVFLLIGLFMGKGVGGLKGAAKQAIKGDFHISIPFKANKVLVLSNFESADDLKRWKLRQAVLEQSPEHATQGKYSGKWLSFGNVESSNILMENFLEDNPNFGNWTGFYQLKFDVYNSGGDTERIILKVKDADDRAWQKNIFLPPNQSTEVKVYIAELKDSLNLSQIRQFNLFRWAPGSETTFYLDNVRLMPEGVDEKAAAQRSAKEEKPSGQQASKNNKFLFDTQNSVLGLAVAGPAEKVFQEPNKFQGIAGDVVEISLARNEYESKQLVINAKKQLQGVTIEKNDLIANINGNEVRIDKKNIKCYIVGYVKTQKPDYAVSYVGWWPDPLEEKASFNIKENSLQPIWIEVYAPQDVPAGDYSSDINIKLPDGSSKTVKLKVKVWDFTLSKETHLKTAFDFYGGRMKKMYPQSPGESQEEYAGRMSDMETRYYIDMIKHRIMPIFNFPVDSGFFAKDIKPYLNNGLSAFAIGQHGGSFDNDWPKNPQKLNELIGTYRDYAMVLKASRLIDKAYIYTYDEPKYGDPNVDEVTKMIHRADPDLKNMVCMGSLSNPDNYPDWGNDIDIWCIRNVMFNEKMADVYKNKGKDIWIYVSGPEPPYPTLVIDYPALAYRIIPWQCWKYGIKGYLYWCVDFWNENPWQNTMNTKWGQNGNGLLYYPGEKGPVTSIRLEATRDGIEDYEYFYLLDQKIKEAEAKELDAPGKALVENAKKLLTIDSSIVESMSDYAKDPDLLYKRRSDIAEAIQGLDKLLQGKTAGQTPLNEGLKDQSQLTLELYRGGKFVKDEQSASLWQKSDSYRDSAIIRSTDPLPKTYKINAVVGEINYDLSNIEGLAQDPEYKEGPQNENGCYLLAVTDEAPIGHHTNDWWHQHRKVCIDVDNNVWGSGMPNPIFLTYYDTSNKMLAFNGETEQWGTKWDKAVTYDPAKWYKVEIEKTDHKFILKVYDDKGKFLKGGMVALKDVWHEDGAHPDYLVIGDPHENYYQGSMKIKAINIQATENGKT